MHTSEWHQAPGPLSCEYEHVLCVSVYVWISTVHVWIFTYVARRFLLVCVNIFMCMRMYDPPF
jgi:hypothetical protein